MKLISLLFIFLFNVSLNATELQKITLTSDQKLEGTFSIKLNNNNSLHLLFIKDSKSKNNVLKPFLVSQSKQIKQFSDYVSSKKLNIIASHCDNNSSTLIFFDDSSKKLLLLNYDNTSGIFKEKTIEKYSKPDIIMSSKGKTYFVQYNPIKDKSKIFVDVIDSSTSINNIEIALDNDLQSKIRVAFFNEVDAINQEEFVENGSIKSARAYLYNENIYITKEKDNNTVNLFGLDLNHGKINFYNYDFNLDDKIKDHNTFIFENKLININSFYDDFKISYYDVSDTRLIKQHSLNNDFKNIFEADKIQNFLELEKKISLKITTTINKTIDNNYLITISRVNVNTYKYGYDWWWNHMFMMQQMQMQQMIRVNTGGFGPNNLENNYFNINLEKKDNISLQYVINDNFEILEKNNTETLHKNIDKDSVLKEFEEDKLIKSFSGSFTENNEFRYVYQNNKTKEVYISYKNIN